MVFVRDMVHGENLEGLYRRDTAIARAHTLNGDGAGLNRNQDCKACLAKAKEVAQRLGEKEAEEFWIFGLGRTDRQ